MRFTVVVASLEDTIADPDVVVAELVNDAKKRVRVEAATEQQYYSALKNELMKKPQVKRVFIIRGIYARSDNEACKQAKELYNLTYGKDGAIGAIAFPSFYQIIDPVKEECKGMKLLGAYAFLGVLSAFLRLLR